MSNDKDKRDGKLNCSHGLNKEYSAMVSALALEPNELEIVITIKPKELKSLNMKAVTDSFLNQFLDQSCEILGLKPREVTHV